MKNMLPVAVPRRWTAVVALIVCAAVACGRSEYLARSEQAGFIPQTNLTLVVRNENVSAARVFAVEEGTWKYIGSVKGRSSDDFELWAFGQSGAPLRLLATLAGGRDTVRAAPLAVLPGQLVTLTIEPDASRSSVAVR